ncbi:MAG: alpha/beta hydrolase [Candidatus Marinimicrobia bacterium]|nr:alpha/beta hydrolase [Candidatus Neomarinimicrobiota bacterium]
MGTGHPRGYPNYTLLEWSILLGLEKLVDVKPPIPPTVIEYRDIVYKTTESRPLKLDIYHPRNLDKPTPVLIFIHGGAWKSGDKSDYLRYLVDFAERGYVTVSLSYRFSQEAVFPAAVKDVKCALKWIRSHAEDYFIDPNQIAVIGGSAGGHLAMMIGYSPETEIFEGNCDCDSISSRVNAVVNLYGAVDLTTDFAIAQQSAKQFIGGEYNDHKEAYQNASPINYITKDDPPTLIFHGTLDTIVPVDQADILTDKLTKVGAPFIYHRLKGWPHTMDAAMSVNQFCQSEMMKFFETYVPLSNE